MPFQPARCLLLVLPWVIASGCASPEPSGSRPLKVVYGSGESLFRYRIATILPLDLNHVRVGDLDPGLLFSYRLAEHLRQDFGQLFQEVRTGPSVHRWDELVIGGRVLKFQEPVRSGREPAPGNVIPSFEAELVLQDGVTGNPLLVVPVDPVPGGSAKTNAVEIEEVINQSAKEAAVIIARKKGWQPPDTKR